MTTTIRLCFSECLNVKLADIVQAYRLSTVVFLPKSFQDFSLGCFALGSKELVLLSFFGVSKCE